MRDMGLYRGKRVDNGEWVEGYFFAGNIAGAFILQTKTKCTRRRDGSSALGDDVVPFEVDPATVGEFTGLCDRNGKRIFEGDVVVDKVDGETLSVWWNELQSRFECREGRFSPVTVATIAQDAEVTGTIHDAKEG
jgi:hypothetical protein